MKNSKIGNKKIEQEHTNLPRNHRQKKPRAKEKRIHYIKYEYKRESGYLKNVIYIYIVREQLNKKLRPKIIQVYIVPPTTSVVSDSRGKSFERNSNTSNGNQGKSKNGREKLRNDRNLECWKCSKTSDHLKKNCRASRKNEDKNNDASNIVTNEVRDALILSVDDSCDS